MDDYSVVNEFSHLEEDDDCDVFSASVPEINFGLLCDTRRQVRTGCHYFFYSALYFYTFLVVTYRGFLIFITRLFIKLCVSFWSLQWRERNTE